jgi:hypothetical protein
MTWYFWILAIYAGIAVLCFARYLVIVKVAIKELSKMGVKEMKLSKMVGTITLDALKWPVYVVWHGLKRFLEELK